MSIAEQSLVSEKLSQSRILRDYQHAFSEATGLPLQFEPAGRKRPGMRNSKQANPFCLQLSETEPGCRMCVEMQQQLTSGEGNETRSAACLAGLTDSSVPVRAGEKILGYLQTGQIALKRLTKGDFQKVLAWLRDGGANIDCAALEEAYLGTPVVSKKRYEAVLRLLEVFAQHLSLAAEQIVTQQEHTQPAQVEQARQLIEERHAEDLALGDVAHAVNVSTFHFCKMFKKATGMTFTEYLSLVRIGNAKKLLANPQVRISEVAFEVGFASVTHFNRMFRRIAGESPTAFRRKLCPATAK